MSATDELLVSLDDRVLTLTFNRPEKLNALSAQIHERALAQLQDSISNPDVGCIVVTGAGRAFCAGGDVSAMEGRAAVETTLEQRVDGQRAGHELSRLLHDMPKVTIAAVNGHAVGAGLGIAVSCDLRIASENAKFGTAFARVGFGGDYGTTCGLVRLLGEAKAKEMFFLPDIIDAQEAHRIGLANRVLPADTFQDEVQQLARRIAHGPLVSYRYMKENANLSATNDFRTMLDREALTHLRCGMTEDHLEGVQAFMEKREPVFRGR